jgi:hypothetical protein
MASEAGVEDVLVDGEKDEKHAKDVYSSSVSPLRIDEFIYMFHPCMDNT